MKNFALSLSTIAIICLVGWIIFAQECKRSKEGEIPLGYSLISQEALDSLEEVANRPADTIYLDTVKERIVIKWNNLPVPVPVALDSETNYYVDTLTSDSSNTPVKVWAELWIIGQLKRWSLGGEVLKTTIDRVIEVPKPVIITNKIDVPVLEKGIFLGLQTGGSPQGGLMFGAELTYLNRKSNYYGLGASRFGEFNIYQFSFGKRLLHW